MKLKKIRSTYLDDADLSWEGRGMLAYLLSLPPGSDVSLAGLERLTPQGLDKVRSIMTELYRLGYVFKTIEDRHYIIASDYPMDATPEGVGKSNAIPPVKIRDDSAPLGANAYMDAYYKTLGYNPSNPARQMKGITEIIEAGYTLTEFTECLKHMMSQKFYRERKKQISTQEIHSNLGPFTSNRRKKEIKSTWLE